jgi:hypothetical protein
MIDTNFNTWLIEINKNPALEYSTVRECLWNVFIVFSLSPNECRDNCSVI